jgi:hypothetical protein
MDKVAQGLGQPRNYFSESYGASLYKSLLGHLYYENALTFLPIVIINL